MERILRDFERKGIELQDKERDEVKALQIDIQKEENTANKAIQDSATKDPLKVEAKDGLKGMPDDFINKLTKPTGGAEEQKKREIHMKYHEVLPIMRLCENEETRK